MKIQAVSLVRIFPLFSILLSAALPLKDGDSGKSKSEKAPISEEDKRLLTLEELAKAEVGLQKARRACVRLDLSEHMGSSVIIKVPSKAPDDVKDKYVVVTNEHCVAKKGQAVTEYEITLPGSDIPSQEQQYNIKLLKAFREYDIAVYEILDPRPNVPALEFHDGQVDLGMKVATVGWPWGRGMEDGYAVIDIGRIVRGDWKFKVVPADIRKGDEPIATGDIAINQESGGETCNFGKGSSGGPLVDLDGRIVGINFGAKDNYTGAVPVQLVRRLVEEAVGPPVK